MRRSTKDAVKALNKAGYAIRAVGKTQMFVTRSQIGGTWLKIINDTVSEQDLKTLLRAVGCGYL